MFENLTPQEVARIATLSKAELTKYILSSCKVNERNQIILVKANPSNIRHIKTPSEKVQLAAVTTPCFITVLRWIKNPSEKIQLKAIKKSSYELICIKNPSEKVQLSAVRKCGDVIKYIKNPSKAVQIASVRHCRSCGLPWMNKPIDDDVYVAAVKYDYHNVGYVDNPSEQIQMIAVEQSIDAINYIEKPTRKVKKYVKEMKNNS